MKYGLLIWFSLTGFMGYSQISPPGDKPERVVQGNSFLFKDWSDGILYYSSGRVLSQFKLKFNCASNQLLLQFEGNSFGAESKVQAFTIYTGSRKNRDSMVFRKGFPPTGKANAETFYQVLLEGKFPLLRLFVKNIIEEKRLIIGQESAYYKDEEEYYLLRQGKLEQLSSEKNELIRQFPGREEEMMKFIDANKLRFRSADDYIRLVRYYDTLVS